MSLLRDLRTW